MKTIVYFYSHKGSNKYLANRIATDLKCETEEIFPLLNAHLIMLMGLNFGNRRLKSAVENYDRVILCGPIWMGKLIVPLKNFIKKHVNKIDNLIFVSCCGSTFDKKDEKFGHNLVFNEVKKLSGEKCIHCEAFPITLVLPDDQKDDSEAFMKTHLNDNNFKGEIIGIYDVFIRKLKASDSLVQ
jgi:menaquinone-dependent protoporphyrinogen IX oxidase